MSTTTTRATAVGRLSFLLALAGAAWALSCRPAWSPDGRRIAYPARLPGEQLAVALYDRETGDNRLLSPPERPVKQAVAAWTPDGAALVLLTSSTDHDRLGVEVRPNRGEARHFELETTGNATDQLLLPPALTDGALLLGGKRIQRLDLETGAVTEADAPAGAGVEYVLGRQGGAVYYTVRPAREATAWEIGTIDPDTLARTPVVAAPTEPRWHVVPTPAVEPRSGRIAVVAHPAVEAGDGGKDADDERQSILVFRDGELEVTIPLAGALAGPLAWGADGVTLFALVARSVEPEGQQAVPTVAADLLLLESDFSGTVRRETPVLRLSSPETRDDGLDKPRLLPFLAQLALSPDGGTAAVSTAYLSSLPEEQHGLLLIDLEHRERAVTRVPFPKPDAGR